MLLVPSKLLEKTSLGSLSFCVALVAGLFVAHGYCAEVGKPAVRSATAKSATAHADGVGSGGGGSEIEARIVKRFWEVLDRVDRLQTDAEIKKLVSAIKTTLKRPLKIEFTSQLEYCDSLTPVRESKDAWGCPGRLQLLSSFDASDDSMIFHELTRITPDYLNIDDGMGISIGRLSLNRKLTRSVMVKESYQKQQYTNDYVQGEGQLRMKAGALAVGIQEDANKYILTSFWSEITDKQSDPADDGVAIQH